jgi:hypothetical protein
VILIYELSGRVVLLRINDKREISLQNDDTKKFVPLKQYLEITGLLNKPGKRSDYKKMIQLIKDKTSDEEVYEYLTLEMGKLGFKYHTKISEEAYEEALKRK